MCSFIIRFLFLLYNFIQILFLAVPQAMAYLQYPNFSISILTPPFLNANNFLLIDFDSDQILAQDNIDEKIEPASLTKMMSIYVVDHEIYHGNIQLTDQVFISNKAGHAPGSRMFLEVASKVTVNELMKGVIIQSGNDASIALAEHIAGTESAFVDLMNSYANVLGMSNTHFTNSTGLPDPEHYTSVKDISLLAKALIKDFPKSYKLYSEKKFTFNGIEQLNRNILLWRNDSVDGIKTGHTDSAGYCLVASGKRDNMRLIAVIIGAKNDKIRTNEANKLLIWGFRFFETHKLYKAGEPFQNIRVWMGDINTLDIGFHKDLYVTIPRGQYKNIAVFLDVPKYLKAPVKKDLQIGTYKVELKDQILIKKPIIALETVNVANLLGRLINIVTISFESFWEKVSCKM